MSSFKKRPIFLELPPFVNNDELNLGKWCRVGRRVKADDSIPRGLGFDSHDGLKMFVFIFYGCHD